jgi:hypothetical protein
MISDKLRKIYSDIHSKTKFGKRAKMPPHLENFIKEIEPESILDFGCGKGKLLETLSEKYPSITLNGYDPATPEYDMPLVKSDLIISTDVLEHIEYEHIDATLKEIQDSSHYVYHLISCAPAKLILPDGRNAHIIQEDPQWWKSKFESLGYKILSEDYREFSKFSKQLQKELPVKNYYIMAVNERWVS